MYRRRRLLLCPREFQLCADGQLVAGEEVPQGAVFLPWRGEVTTIHQEPPPVGEEEEAARRHYGLLDTPSACNWLLFLAQAEEGTVPNLSASCCPTLGTPRLTALSPLGPGTRLACSYSALPPSLLLQLQQLPPLALLRLLAPRDTIGTAFIGPTRPRLLVNSFN